MQGLIYDYLPESLLEQVRNLGTFCRDSGAGQVDLQRQRAAGGILEEGPGAEVHGIFIDQGYCFNAGEWSFPDSPLRGVYARNDVYRGVTGWESFQPWLGNIESDGRAGDVALRRGDSAGVVRRELRAGAAGGDPGTTAGTGGRADPGVQEIEPGAIPKMEGCGELREAEARKMEGWGRMGSGRL